MLATILQPQRHPPAFPTAAVATRKSTALANADRCGIELPVARERRPALRPASPAAPAHRAAGFSRARAAPSLRCSRWPQKSVESWNLVGRGVLPPAGSLLP